MSKTIQELQRDLETWERCLALINDKERIEELIRIRIGDIKCKIKELQDSHGTCSHS